MPGAWGEFDLAWFARNIFSSSQRDYYFRATINADHAFNGALSSADRIYNVALAEFRPISLAFAELCLANNEASRAYDEAIARAFFEASQK